METLNVKLTFDMQKALLALRKPYEDMAATLHRVLESSLPEMQVANTRILKRSEKRWPLILTDEQARRTNFNVSSPRCVKTDLTTVTKI